MPNPGKNPSPLSDLFPVEVTKQMPHFSGPSWPYPDSRSLLVFPGAPRDTARPAAVGRYKAHESPEQSPAHAHRASDQPDAPDRRTLALS